MLIISGGSFKLQLKKTKDTFAKGTEGSILQNLHIFRTIILILVFLFSKNIYGQLTIMGKVSDTTNHPLEFATILLSKDSSIIASTITDSMGLYHISNLPPQTCLLTVSHINAKDVVIHFSFKRDTVLNVILKGKYTSLKAITVYGQREFERKADRFIYTPNKYITEGNSAIDMMRHVPLIKYDEKSNAFSLIGKSGTVVYINNKKTEIPKEMLTEMLRAMPAENIKNVELITNPGSEYTANTTGGVININIKRQLYEGWLGTLSFATQQGPYNISILNSFINYRKGKIALQFSPSINSSYNYSTSESQLTYTNRTQNILYSRNYRSYWVFGNGLRMDYDIDKKNFLSYSGWFSAVSGKSNPSTIAQFSKIGQTYPDFTQSVRNSGKDFYIYNFGNVNYHRSIDSTGETYLDANIDYNQFFQQQRSDWSINDVNLDGTIKNDIGQYKNNLPQKFFNLSARLEYGKTLSHNTKLIVGGQLSSTAVDNDQKYYTLYQNDYILDNFQSLHYHYNEKYYAGFASLSKSFKEKWDVKVGLRFEGTNYSTKEEKVAISVDSNYINLYPNASFSYSLNQLNQFSLSYGRKIMRPNIELLFPGRTYFSQNYFSQNNPFLQPVLSDIVEFSYTLMSKYIFSLTYLNSANSYANFILPIIENDTAKLKRTFYNYGTSKSLNFVINIHQFIFKNFWEFNITPSYNYNKYNGTSIEVPVNIINHSFNLYFDNYIYISKKKQWTGFVTFRYGSPSKDVSGSRLNSISSVDLEVKKVIKKFTINLILSDVYNGSSKEKYNLFSNYLLSENRLNTNDYRRAFVFKVRYNFGNNRLSTTKNRASANDDIRQRIN